MHSAGDEIDKYLRVVRTMIDSLGWTFEGSVVQAAVPHEIVDAVRTRWEQEKSQIAAPARVLSATRGGKRPWFKQWDPSQGYYWLRLRKYLVDRLERPLPMVDSLDDSTDKVLANLEDPRPSGPASFRVQGLVVGHVQSGKTANYSALITKAADAGYKFVIVLAGIHNELRRQTQLRLNRELGIGQEGKEAVGEPVAGQQWIAITGTGLHEDFKPGTVNSAFLQGNDHVLAVVKKNGPVLRRLIAWMRGKVPAGLPVLIIDDEADQASINTGGNRDDVSLTLDDEDRDTDAPGNETAPSVINGRIRELLTIFKRVCFVAYTATPFANCLIPHDAEDRDVYHDLYPRDFIISLPRPPTYFGAERLFGRPALPGEREELAPLDVIRIVPGSHRPYLIPENRAKTPTFQPRVPPSLKHALLDFILGLAVRCHRGDADKPACMLVHINYRTVVQDRLQLVIDDELKALRNAWRYDKKRVPELEKRWLKDFRPTIQALDASRDIPFSALHGHLDQVFKEPIRVLLLNSGSPDQLDYEAEPGLKAVIIGGNRLSRGLTLEGLLVSYFLRETLFYDTLMQMGRWFGYREDYVDLTRLWTTVDLISNFRDLALAEEELRHEIGRYERELLTPIDFGPKIRVHPVMLVTAHNKMGAARVIQQSYSGRLLQTVNFRLSDIPWLQHNLDATRKFIKGLGTPAPEDTGMLWSGIDVEKVAQFLEEYRTVPMARFDIDTVRRYVLEQARRGELTQWTVSIRSRNDSSLGTEDLGAPSPVNLIARTRIQNMLDNIGSLVNPTIKSKRGGDEEIGLSEAQIAAALKAVRDNTGVEYGDALRAQRSPAEGLLLLYPISRDSRPTKAGHRQPLFENPADGCTVVGMAISFPVSSNEVSVEYVANLAGV